MMRKIHLIQNTDLIKTKKLADNHNAKVTVQYIQNPQLYQKQENVDHKNNEDVSPQEDLDVENVEYLEDNTNVEEYIEDSSGKEEDIFYPNAIHCLLDLYKNRYDDLVAHNGTANVTRLWRDIAKQMQESFFDFNEHQIKLKYISLRGQYLSLQTKEEIENFDYFGQLHDIYKDQSKENILRGHQANKIIPYYKDEIFLQPEQVKFNGTPIHGFKSKSEEIAHKEHEFIDMVEKEMQAMEGGVQVETAKAEIRENKNRQCSSSTKLKSRSSSIEQGQNKRPRLNTEFSEERKESNEHEKTGLRENCFLGNNDFSLYLYNQDQERRHREKMTLLEKSLNIQERALEQQQQLLRELIKRLPS